MLTIKYLCTGSAKEVDFVARAFAHTVKKKVGMQKPDTHLQGEERVPLSSLGHGVMVSASFTATLGIGAREHLFPLGQSRSLHVYLCRRQDGSEG